MTTLRLLAVAINSKRMGYVLFSGNQLKDWRAMTKPTRSRAEAAGAMQRLINEYRPDIVVTEFTKARNERTAAVLHLKDALNRTAAQNYVLDVNVERPRDYANKYEEAAAFGVHYPELKPMVPPARGVFDHQPARLILFDAIALAHKVLQRPTQHLASAMG